MAGEAEPFNWFSALAGAAISLGGLFIVFVARGIFNRTRRLFFVAEDWEARYFEATQHGDFYAEPKPRPNTKYAELRGTVKFFTRRPLAIALHKLAIEVRQGERKDGKLIHLATDLNHGPPQASHARVTYARLTELVIPQDQWIVETIHTVVKDYGAIQGASLWFAGTTAEGKRHMWFLTQLPNYPVPEGPGFESVLP